MRNEEAEAEELRAFRYTFRSVLAGPLLAARSVIKCASLPDNNIFPLTVVLGPRCLLPDPSPNAARCEVCLFEVALQTAAPARHISLPSRFCR